jgi:hypothetical protein
MGRDAEDAEKYLEISSSLAAMAKSFATRESDKPLEQLLLSMSSNYGKLGATSSLVNKSPTESAAAS